MNIQYMGLEEVNDPLIFLSGVKDVGYGEVVEIEIAHDDVRHGQVIYIAGDRVGIQVFEGTEGISLKNTKTAFKGRPMEIGLSKEVLGRIFTGTGEPLDGLGPLFIDEKRDINGLPLNPVARVYPRNYINTGISSIDALTTLIRGQKLPIFSGAGMPHDELAMQIVRQARIAEDQDESDKFCVVFAAMGVKNDVANYFRRSLEEAGVLDQVVMYLNLSNDPIIERILTPRTALTTAEYLAYEHGMHVLVIMTDITFYAEALREFSSSKGEIPGRKGFPGYLYSDLASLFERAGLVEGKDGSVTQIPILSMPNDDITHPIPDLTGYITEGQIVLSRDLHQKGIYPPVATLPSLSRLMKDGIGAGYTREDHKALTDQLFASYSHVQEARSLASVIGEDELSETDKKYIQFGSLFENHFVNQGMSVNRSIEDTLDLGWLLLSLLPKENLDRVDSETLDRHYDPDEAVDRFNIKKKSIVRQYGQKGE
ncbi:MAG: V-type ATP synthase subunit B [Candidatus Izemoplasmataceae bacterium]